jgi:hypothetical protein
VVERFRVSAVAEATPARTPPGAWELALTSSGHALADHPQDAPAESCLAEQESPKVR